MLLRIICRQDDAGDAANLGGPVQSTYMTFDVAVSDHDSLAVWLRGARAFLSRTPIGMEVREEDKPDAQAHD